MKLEKPLFISVYPSIHGSIIGLNSKGEICLNIRIPLLKGIRKADLHLLLAIISSLTMNNKNMFLCMEKQVLTLDNALIIEANDGIALYNFLIAVCDSMELDLKLVCFDDLKKEFTDDESLLGCDRVHIAKNLWPLDLASQDPSAAKNNHRIFEGLVHALLPCEYFRRKFLKERN
ncbi:MAG: hypothetical protein AB8G05_06320 [Oligoflexales bacterium]